MTEIDTTATAEDTEAPRYAAGWNEPGASPNPDVVADFANFSDAIAYLVESVERFWDEDYQGSSARKDRLRIDERWMPVHTVLHNASPVYDNGDSTLDVMTGDRSLAFWITPIEQED